MLEVASGSSALLFLFFFFFAGRAWDVHRVTFSGMYVSGSGDVLLGSMAVVLRIWGLGLGMGFRLGV